MPAPAIVVLVIILDLVVFVGGRMLTMEANQLEIMHAVRAQHENPTPDTQRRMDAAFDTAAASQARGRAIADWSVVVITVGGLATAAWKYRREHREAAASDVRATDANT